MIAPTIIGRSPEMLRVLDMVARVAPTEASVLICGESGTGKELIAKLIHCQSERSRGPFLSINCSALPRDLLESTLFGHKHGSFTGAIHDYQGHFAACRGGTFFLDEIGDMAIETQPKLLRALQEKECIPVGLSKIVTIDVRMVAATNMNLDAAVRSGHFRRDLFYRLSVIPIRLPSLRQRPDDIPALTEHFLAGRKQLTPRALDALMAYDWPGNVRELENAVERAVILSRSDAIAPEDFTDSVLLGPAQEHTFDFGPPIVPIDSVEKAYIRAVMQDQGWHPMKAARVLGINASTLYRKRIRYGLFGGPRPMELQPAAEGR